jgi:hypothetical protein
MQTVIIGKASFGPIVSPPLPHAPSIASPTIFPTLVADGSNLSFQSTPAGISHANS